MSSSIPSFFLSSKYRELVSQDVRTRIIDKIYMRINSELVLDAVTLYLKVTINAGN